MTASRRVAIDTLVRIERDGAFANLVLPAALDRSDLDRRDRAFVTELVYGTTRMRRACDWMVERFLLRDDLDDVARAALRVGAYQIGFTAVPPHAAVAETVGAVPKRLRGLVNAVLRRVSDAPLDWPSEGVRLSYPDWIVARLTEDLGATDAIAALERMNVAPEVTERADGVVQDRASQWVAALVGTGPGQLVADVCAAPGGKATAMQGTVVASDVRARRVGLIPDTVLRVVADGCRPPYRPGSFDRVLVDAPCSGLGVLRRRPDARWRIEPEAVDRLAALQRRLLAAAVDLLAPDGELVYSVCTMTRAETVDVAATVPLAPLPVPPPWRPWEGGGRLLPHDEDTDGMAVFRWRR